MFAFAYSHNPKSTDWFSETSRVSREDCIPSWSSGKLPRSGLRVVSQVNRRNHLSRKEAYGVGLKLAAAPPGAPKLMTVFFLSAEAQIGGFQVVSWWARSMQMSMRNIVWEQTVQTKQTQALPPQFKTRAVFLLLQALSPIVGFNRGHGRLYVVAGKSN